MTDTNARDKIMPAIAAAMGQVQKVGKDGRNTHDGYNFASIDDFLALVNPICAANGLVVTMQEGAIEDFLRKGKYGENAWMRVTWEFTVWHSSGQFLPPVNRTVEVLRNGAQAYGSAQSYALKQFLRSLLLIPTGDKDDADLQPTDAGVVTKEPAPRQPQKQSPAVPDEAIQIAAQSLWSADTLEALRAIWSDLPVNVKTAKAVIDAKDARKAELEAKPADDLGGDGIPEHLK